MSAYRRVLMLADASAGYDRDLLKGVGHYSNFVTGWLFRSYSVEYAEKLCEDLIHTWKPDGVISLSNRWSSPLELAVGLHIPLVQAKPMGDALPAHVPSIHTDPRLIASMVVEYFMSRGLRSIGYVGSSRGETYMQDKLLADAVLARGLVYQSFHGDPRSEFDTKNQFGQWVSNIPKRTGVLASSDWFAWHAISASVDLGLKVPDDIAFVGIGDDSPWCELAPVPLSSIALAAEKIGYRAASMLDQLMRGQSLPELRVLIPPVGIVARRSTEVIAAEDPDVAAALRFIHDHAAEGCTVKQVLREVAIDRRRLERWCRQQLGRSPLDEIQKLRFANVKRLLAETDERLEEIARKAGFVSATVLCRAFARQTGTTVAKYRRQFRRAAITAANIVGG